MRSSGQTVADVGEIDLVDRVMSLLGDAGEGVLRGPGDDAAVVDPSGTQLVLSTDSQQEGVHFRPDWISPVDLGRRALAVNVSDLGAMGAGPLWALVALALPASTSLAWVEDLARGLRRAGEEFGCSVIGGDVTRVPDRIGITITVVGGLPPGCTPVLRSGAQPGDLCWTTGYPGRAAAGRCLLGNGYRWVLRDDAPEGVVIECEGVPVEADAGRGEAIACLGAYLRPSPPVAFGVRLAEAGLATAMIDLSDGLGIDLLRLCRASRVGVELELEGIGRRSDLERWEAKGLGRAREWVLGGGDDYQLLGTTPAQAEVDLRQLASDFGVPLHVIGKLGEPEGGFWVRDEGRRVPLHASGWDHFSDTVIVD